MAYEVMSCIKPSGELHIGNYFGAIRSWVQLQETYQCLFGIVDLHAMTGPYQPEKLRFQTDQYFLDLLACGMDPQKSILFVQSLVPEHLELAWILGTVTSVDDVWDQPAWQKQRAAARDDQDPRLSIGLLTYPILQAADILAYKSAIVPVGKDQVSHIQLAGRIATQFNERYGETFPLPVVHTTDSPRIASLLDPALKMSKSMDPGHAIGLFEETESIRQKILQVDTTHPEKGEKAVENLLQILRAAGEESAAQYFEAQKSSDALDVPELKEALMQALGEMTTRLRERRQELATDQTLLNDTIREMSHQAHQIAKDTIYEVRSKVGIKSVSYF